jgi:hypothetical protein
MLTARTLKALLDNLHPGTELDLPVVICACWWNGDMVVSDFATVTPAGITLHRQPAAPVLMV